MRNDVHFAALRAAAKVAFSMASVALVNGCSSSDGTATANDGDKTDESASNESAVISKDTAAKPCPDAGPAKPSCGALLASTFPKADHPVFEPIPVSADVVACCDTELDTHGSDSQYRWQCCFAYDPATVPPGQEPPDGWSGHGLACTPWGPPVPPSMDRLLAGRRARFTRPVSDVSILKAVA